MTKIAISGHRGLPDKTSKLVESAIRQEVAKRSGSSLVGLSCLADGPDSMFAESVLDNGGELVAIIPASEYRDGLPKTHHEKYDELLARASDTIALDYEESDSRAHMDASTRMLEEADELIAVWDGSPARGYGGTADVVSVANDYRVPVTVVWPAGATRD